LLKLHVERYAHSYQPSHAANWRYETVLRVGVCERVLFLIIHLNICTEFRLTVQFFMHRKQRSVINSERHPAAFAKIFVYSGLYNVNDRGRLHESNSSAYYRWLDNGYKFSHGLQVSMRISSRLYSQP